MRALAGACTGLIPGSMIWGRTFGNRVCRGFSRTLFEKPSFRVNSSVHGPEFVSLSLWCFVFGSPRA